MVKLALDMDMKDIGASCIPEEINRGKVDSITGPMVLMVTKVSLHSSSIRYSYILSRCEILLHPRPKKKAKLVPGCSKCH